MDTVIDKKYIKDMLKKYPLMPEDNLVDLRDYTLDMVSGIASISSIEHENIHLPINLPIKVDQGSIGACTCCATTSDIMYTKGSANPLSWWFLYADRDDSDFQGIGCYERQVLDHARKDGVPLLSLFNVAKEYPAIRDDLMNSPNKDEIFENAANNKIGGYVKVDQSEVYGLLAQGIPVLISVKVYSNFYQAINNNYEVPTDPEGTKLGNHEMLIIGWQSGKYELFNSWGNEWDHNLWLDENSSIINDYYMITDKPINKPVVVNYRVGWDKDATGKWIYSEDGVTLAKDCWKQIKYLWYYFNNIYAVDGDWVLWKNKWYYFESQTCAMVTDKWILWKEKWYRIGSDGAMLTGWYYESPAKKYYLDLDKGYCYTDCTILIDGINYTFDSNGVCIS
jgi:hypothetical protein